MIYSDDKRFIQKIGKQIKLLRKAQNLTQFDLAIKSGMEENSLQRIEVGRTNPTIKTLLKIVNALEIEFIQLFDFDNSIISMKQDIENDLYSKTSEDDSISDSSKEKPSKKKDS